MELFSVLIPFLVAGFMCAILSRLTGASITMLLMPYVLYLGARPMELVAFMLTFIVYNNFTMETQAARISVKKLRFFPGWKMAIPIGGMLATLLVQPFLSMAIFVGAFIMELGATIYDRLPEHRRPTVKSILSTTLWSTLFSVGGVLVVSAVFVQSAWADQLSEYYYIFAGLGILIYVAFAGHAGAHRNAFKGSWQTVLAALHIFMGACGIEGSSYVAGLRRDFDSRIDYMIGLVTISAAFVSLLVVFALHAQFSMPALIAAIGSSLGVRILGSYEFNNRGGFSYAAMGLLILVVVCLYLVQPLPQGFNYIEQLLG